VDDVVVVSAMACAAVPGGGLGAVVVVGAAAERSRSKRFANSARTKSSCLQQYISLARLRTSGVEHPGIGHKSFVSVHPSRSLSAILDEVSTADAAPGETV